MEANMEFCKSCLYLYKKIYEELESNTYTFHLYCMCVTPWNHEHLYEGKNSWCLTCRDYEDNGGQR